MDKHKIRVNVGWVSISLALGISAYSNLNCSFQCAGVFGTIWNPLMILGLMLYLIGTYLILFWGD